MEAILVNPPKIHGQQRLLRSTGFLDAIARRYRGALTAFFRRRLREPQDCEDLTQEVFLRLAKRGELQTIDHVEGYLFQTAAAVLIDHGRREVTTLRNRLNFYGEEKDPVEDFSPERVLLGKEQVDRALAAIEALPQRARHAMVLFRFEGMKQAEIAKIMSISVSAVEKHIKLAMTRLNEAMGDER